MRIQEAVQCFGAPARLESLRPRRHFTDATARLLTAPVQQVFRQAPWLGQYSAILPNETIPAGTILRV